jgi:hypothetical protein
MEKKEKDVWRRNNERNVEKEISEIVWPFTANGRTPMNRKQKGDDDHGNSGTKEF